jgi:membrane-associated protease RseP (regulator of RpoE activity)
MRHILAVGLVLAVGSAGAVLGAEPATAPAVVEEHGPQHWFGVAVENIAPSMAKLLKLKPGQGLMVSAILPDSPAERAGLKVDDLLIEIDGKALMTQEDLYKAANPKGAKKAPKTYRLGYLREGDRMAVNIAPAPRPQSMISFAQNGPNAMQVTTYVVPSGGGAQVGTGYRINRAASDPSDFTIKSIQQIVSKGQTVVLSQETDAAGNLKKTITVGTTVYAVDPQHLEALPAELRALAESWPDSGAAKGGPAAGSASATAPSMEQRLKDLEEQNRELKRRLDELSPKDVKGGAGG